MGSIDQEIFEITDFTCATDWERFVADLESRIREWQLSQDASSPTKENAGLLKRPAEISSHDNIRLMKFDRLVEHVTYGDNVAQLRVSLIFPRSSPSSPFTPAGKGSSQPIMKKAAQDVDGDKYSYLPLAVRDMVEPTFDFVHEWVDMGHHIVRYFGLRRFIVLEPSSFDSASKALSDDSFINLLLSAVAIATLNTCCDVPVLLQVADQWNWLYNGICQNSNVRTHFEMVHLRNPPPKCSHLAGILDMFKEHVGCSLTSPPPVKVSVRITYELKEPLESGWPGEVETPEGPLDTVCGVKDLSLLPFGAVEDAINHLHLSATWMNLNEDMLVENEVYSDLDPLAAPFWNCTVDFTEYGVMLMTEALQRFLDLAGCYKDVDDILGPIATGAPAAATALGRLTRSSWIGQLNIPHTASSVLSAASPISKVQQGPLDDAALGRLLQFLFPDADLEHCEDGQVPKNAPTSTSEGESLLERGSLATPPGTAVSVDSVRKETESTSSRNNAASGGYDIAPSLKKAKAAPRGSLTSRLALAICHLATSMQGLQAVCHIWREFVLELRYRWEHGVALPGFEDSNPSLADCLFQQKLQLLNCCILHKIKRQNYQQVAPDDSTASLSASSKSGDEFFDCYEDTTDIDLATLSKPDGRLRPLSQDAFLLENPTELLYIPVTQDPAPLTEDAIEQYRCTLTSMGTSEESALARAKIQTPSLFSDMEAFKAANPKALMEDFIRWYSPRDWIEVADAQTEGAKGELSERMSTPGNLWREVWENARPIPVSRQKRLFDDTREAEKILHWLQEMKVSEFINHLLPSLFLCSIFQLHEEAGPVNKDLRRLVVDIERLVSRYRTLVGRLSSNVIPKEKSDAPIDVNFEVQQFALELLTEKDLKILGAARGFIGRVIANMFSKDVRLRSESKAEDAQRFPPFYCKEFILRWLVPRPQAKSRECPQRCYFRVKSNEFRAASAFTEDVVYFLPDKL